MTNHFQRLIATVTTVLVIALAFDSHAMGQTFNNGIQVPPVPPNIQVPAGNTAYLLGHAVGTQNYLCQATQSGFSWKLLGPQATLFVKLQFGSTFIPQQIATHFLSPNPNENGTPRPTWQGSFDTSAVWGSAAASSTDPAYVSPGAIPWLLVQVVGAQNGPTGGSMLSQTTYIHRLNTAGGVAPATGCSQSSEAGSVALAPYTTDYYFYKKK
jgi:hypothetical protein